MKEINQFIIERLKLCSNDDLKNLLTERLKLNKDTKIRALSEKEINDTVEHIFKRFKIFNTFMYYNEWKNSLYDFIKDNNISKNNLSEPFVLGKDCNYIMRVTNLNYKHGRYKYSMECMNEATIILGDEDKDYCQIFMSNKCILYTSTPKNNISYSVYLLIN